MLIFNLFNDLNYIILSIITIVFVAFIGIRINKKYEFGIISIFFIIICIFLIIDITMDYVSYFKDTNNLMKTQNDWGAMGDYFGGILNPLLTFITIIILLLTTHSQNKELKKQLERQNQESKKNDFDRMFTLMLEQHNNFFLQKEFGNNIEDIYCCFTKYETNNQFDNSKKLFFQWDYFELESIFKNKNANIINSYLRFLYRFLKYLSENKDTVNDINEYSDILRSLISEKLLYIIAMNGMRDKDNKNKFINYRKLLEEFNFLEHINLMTFHNNNEYLKVFHNYSSYRNLPNQIDPENVEYFKNFYDRHFTEAKNELLKIKFSLNNNSLIYGIYTKYSFSAFDKNSFYLDLIIPALTFLVEKNRLPKDLLDNKSNKN